MVIASEQIRSEHPRSHVPLVTKERRGWEGGEGRMGRGRGEDGKGERRGWEGGEGKIGRERGEDGRRRGEDGRGERMGGGEGRMGGEG